MGGVGGWGGYGGGGLGDGVDGGDWGGMWTKVSSMRTEISCQLSLTRITLSYFGALLHSTTVIEPTWTRKTKHLSNQHGCSNLKLRLNDKTHMHYQ
jgi:hypothetical protein